VNSGASGDSLVTVVSLVPRGCDSCLGQNPFVWDLSLGIFQCVDLNVCCGLRGGLRCADFLMVNTYSDSVSVAH
jgi:hypothetical protein